MFRKTCLLSISAALLLGNLTGLLGCLVNADPYKELSKDPYESDPQDTALNNNAFARASAIDLSNDQADIASVLTLDDVDVYDLGPMAPGDKLSVHVNIPDRILLNASVGIFDSNGRLFYLTGEFAHITMDPLADAKFPAFTPKFDFIVRQATEPLYLAVASQSEPLDPFNPYGGQGYQGFTGGPYSIDIKVARGETVPAPSKQVVLLEFGSASVDYPPMQAFGQVYDDPPYNLAGLNGRVMDPAWWRPFIILEAYATQSYQAAQQFWDNFLQFVNQYQPQALRPNTQGVQAAQLPGIVQGQLFAARRQALANPGGFTPTDTRWFLNNGYRWLFMLAEYLGPAVGQQMPGLNVWDSIFPSLPRSPDAAFGDFLQMTDGIRAQLETLYDDIDIEFLVSGVDSVPAGVQVSTLYFTSDFYGGFGSPTGILGAASAIDMLNQDPADFVVMWGGELGYWNAVSLALNLGGTVTTSADSFKYLGSIGGHELGHILGLVHVEDMLAVMHYQTGAQQANNAVFRTSPIFDQMFPVGYQDDFLLLMLEMGLK